MLLDLALVAFGFSLRYWVPPAWRWLLNKARAQFPSLPF